MLYIFLVDTGTMVQFEMDLALETVGHLKRVIAKSGVCKFLPPDRQVLLISGGDTLEEDSRVCKYNAGTDTNPIFLFSRCGSVSGPPECPPSPGAGFSAEDLSADASYLEETDAVDRDLDDKVASSLRLPDAQSTVAVRASLAQEYVRAACDQIRICESLIHDQHLQHQGWQAVVANLEDTALALRKRTENLVKIYGRYLEERAPNQELVENFDEDIALLHQIPVFPALLPRSEQEGDAPKDDSGTVSLLAWINSKGSDRSLEQVADSCFRALNKLDASTLEELSLHVNTCLEEANSMQRKEIAGLSDRLQGLEQLLLEAKQYVQEQKELAQAFLQNQQRASGLQDTSILPDLCASHRQQLLVMRNNHGQIVSIRKRCAKAKDELSLNLHARMKWVVMIQDTMAEVGHSVLMHIAELKALSKKLEVLEQLHLAPSIFIATVVEVVRRRAFSRHYLEKTTGLSEKFSKLHGEEMILRKDFTSKLRKHFLAKMFPGMEDLPPAFATDAPRTFDDRLPNVCIGDVEKLRQMFPDLAQSLCIPEEDAFANLLAKSMNQALTTEDGETLLSLHNMPKKIQINTGDIGSMSVMNQLIGGESVTRRKNGINGSNNHGKVSDSETDTDDYDRAVKSKATPCSQLSISTSALEKKKKANKAAARKAGGTLAESTEFIVEEEDTKSSVDPSSSSADPSSSHTATNSSVAPSSSSDGSLLKNLQDSDGAGALTAAAEDDARAIKIAVLSKELYEAEIRQRELEEKNNALKAKYAQDLSEYKGELVKLKEFTVKEQSEFQLGLREVQTQLGAKVETVQSEYERELSRLEEAYRRKVEEAASCLELEREKMEDCNREIDIYRQQMHESNMEINRLKGEHAEAREKWAKESSEALAAAKEEGREESRKLLLGHELELEALREDMKNDERVKHAEDQLKQIREDLSSKCKELEALKRKTRILEANQEEKLNFEKDKIVQILETGFAQREKLAIQKTESEMLARSAQEVQQMSMEFGKKLINELEKADEASKEEARERLESMERKHAEEVAELQAKHEELMAEAVERERASLLEDKERALKAQADRLAGKAKQELDSLRARFKMMQNSGALDRSPSASESELSLEAQVTKHF